MRHKIVNPRLYLQILIKEYYKKYHYEEYLLHEKHADWTSRCLLNKNKIYQWMKNSRKDDISEEFRKELELRKNTPVKNITLNKTTESFQRHWIMFRAIFPNANSTTRSPNLDAVKELIKDWHSIKFENFEKYKNWHRCSIKPNTVSKWVSRLKKNIMLTRTMRRKIKLSKLQTEDKGIFQILILDTA